MKIINLTPHDINIIDGSTVFFDKDLWKHVISPAICNPVVITTIQSSGVVSAKFATVVDGDINGVLVFRKKIIGCDTLPDADDNTIFVVSARYFTAYRAVHGNTDRLYTITEPVYTPDGQTIFGHLGICPWTYISEMN